MNERNNDCSDYGWTREETVRRQRAAGLAMTPAERLQWLEDRLDELLPLLGRAASPDRTPPTTQGSEHSTF
ncbi:MAG: hypothetical protein K8R59_10945 [Thermoanaerobaculales bacterium]|nr:hypothetical protein [Thermoanaerobaculales bacterium]